MRIRKHSIISVPQTDDIAVSYTKDGMYWSIDESEVFVGRSTVLTLAADMLLYLSNFPEEHEELLAMINNISDHLE